MLLNAKWVITPTKLCVSVCVLRVTTTVSALMFACLTVCRCMCHFADCGWLCIMNTYVVLMRTYGVSIWGCHAQYCNRQLMCLLFFLLVSLPSCRFCCSCWLNKLDLDKSWVDFLVAAIRSSSVCLHSRAKLNSCNT